MATATTRRVANSPGMQAGRKLTLADVSSKGSGLPNRYILHGVEGIGKTSFAAQFPRPIFIQTKGETGLETLIDAGQLPEVAHFPEVQNFDELLSAIGELRTGDHDYKTLVIDTLNGAERLCHEHVCNRDFGGDWGERGFSGYMRGFEVSLADWRTLLSELDALRTERKMLPFCLCHTRVKTFKNPEGSDYDRYQPDMHEKSWGLSHKWADVVLFLNYETFVNEKDPKKKGKAVSSQQRIIYTTRHAAYDAKNRLGLPEELSMGASSAEAYQNFLDAVRAARTQPATQEQ